MTVHSFLARIIAIVIVAVAGLSAPASADLGPAQNLALLSSGPLVFGSFDDVYKAANHSAATCPSGTGCLVLVGGSTITTGQSDRILPMPTRAVVLPSAGAAAYSAYLGAQQPTKPAGPISLKPGTRLEIRLGAGLTIISTPSIVLGLANPRSADPCGKDAGPPAVITVEGTNADTLVFNIGGAQGGSLILCNRSHIVLSGGITPDRVTFNVLGKGTGVVLSGGSRIDGGILAPFRTFFGENGAPGLPTIVLGSILAGGSVTLGSHTIVQYYPPQNVGVPARLKFLGTVTVATLPVQLPQPMTVESENNPVQPVLKFPFRANLRGTSKSQVAPPPNGNARGGRRPHLAQFQNFSGVSQNGKTPSDVQFGAGTTTLLEMANDTGALYTNPGGALIRSFDLGQFFLGSAGQGTDPRVYYDAATGNFIVAYEMHPAGGDDIRLGIGSNPGSSFAIYDVANNNTGATFDQPKLGVSSDKIIVSWNNYGTQHGTSYIVIQKAGVVARNASVPAWIWSDDTSRFQIVPANQYSPDKGTHYAATHCCGTSNIDLLAFTGVPGVSPVNFTDSSYGIGSVAEPPPGHQPPGGDPTIVTDDDRSQSAIWQNGNLWTDFNEGCTPANDRSQRDCVRYVELGTPNAGVRQNEQLQWTGNDVYYSSVVQDQGNTDRANLFFGVSFSSPTRFPTAMVLEVPGSAFTSSTPAIIELGGTAAFAACTPKPCPRWGDYTAAARDPNDPTKVWIANQYGGLSNQFWATSVTEIGN